MVGDLPPATSAGGRASFGGSRGGKRARRRFRISLSPRGCTLVPAHPLSLKSAVLGPKPVSALQGDGMSVRGTSLIILGVLREA